VSDVGDGGAGLRCAGCGYDLRLLAAEGRCPECGKPLLTTRLQTARRLAVAEPRFRRAIASGAAWAVLAIVWPVAAELIPVPPLGRWLPTLLLAGALAPSIFVIMACWRLGTRESDVARARLGLGPDARWSNYALRVTAVAWFIPVVMAYGPMYQRFFWGNDLQWLTSVLYLCIFPASVLFWRRIRVLVPRTQSRSIAWQARVLGWVAVGSVIFGLLPELDGGGDLFYWLNRWPLPIVGVGVGQTFRYDWRHGLWRMPFWGPGNLMAFVPVAVSAWMAVVLARVWVTTWWRGGGRGDTVG
jgi:hypothetical protein